MGTRIQRYCSHFSILTFALGYLVSVDSYMNLQLANTEEIIGGNVTGNLGEVLIRCNNVLYIRGVPEEEEDETDQRQQEMDERE
jgi:hypothetical protein